MVRTLSFIWIGSNRQYRPSVLRLLLPSSTKLPLSIQHHCFHLEGLIEQSPGAVLSTCRSFALDKQWTFRTWLQCHRRSIHWSRVLINCTTSLSFFIFFGIPLPCPHCGLLLPPNSRVAVACGSADQVQVRWNLCWHNSFARSCGWIKYIPLHTWVGKVCTGRVSAYGAIPWPESFTCWRASFGATNKMSRSWETQWSSLVAGPNW